MNIYQFIVDSAPEAIRQIRQQLGPQAVVLNVRKLPAGGISRLWSKPRIEVLAGIEPEGSSAADVPPESVFHLDTLDEDPRPTREHQSMVPATDDANCPSGSASGEGTVRAGFQPQEPGPSLLDSADMFQHQNGFLDADPIRMGHALGNGWQLESMLQNMGLAPVHAHQVMDRLSARHGNENDTLHVQISRACSLLAESWENKRGVEPRSNIHVFVGPAGSGKTTALCKWLTQATLLAGHSARVWRLDGATANAAEMLSVYGEILGVPVARSLNADEQTPTDVAFIDLPGVDWRDGSAVRDLAQRLTGLPPAQVHLVLNGAYESSILMAQAKAFMSLPVDDVILTHLDEEQRWGKLWNLVLGTPYQVGWLSAGQNIPGTFQPALPEEILSRQFSIE